ncbi:MAG: S1-like domain-containing RNA-binding protein [Bacteroides sp.]|nr:S1-like domain-containing RNA-binding protein [Roseburia sp.]MCM1347181.1 S1-like domain-containing RNA-binding protein [Bacteroides sp.]MCM1421671.1 S1-like domain-containing RNA-binding protein [Bacteroides sp.]
MEEIRLGKRNRLEVLREVDFGVYLDGGEIGEILLPQRYVPENCKIGDIVDVFLYLDSEERLTATTETPLIEVGQFAYLEVKWTNEFGAFLDWGLMKDLFCPFREQKMRMQQGNSYVVYCYIDSVTYRIAASAKVEKFLSKAMPPYEPGECVDILVQQKTDLGFKAIVEGRFGGLIYGNEIFSDIHTGDKLSAYIKQVREDGKIDLTLQPNGKELVEGFSEKLLNYMLSVEGGFIPFHDKTPAEDIYEKFKVSKKTFKRAVGDLYKHRLIKILDEGLTLTKKGRSRDLED